VRVDVQVRLKPGSDNPSEILAGVVNRMRDMSPQLECLPEAVIFPAFQRLFETGGFGKWYFKGYQSNPPMVKSGLMKAGLTRRNALMNEVDVTRNSIAVFLREQIFLDRSTEGSWGKRKSGGGYFYPAAHQYGLGRCNENLAADLEDSDVEKMADLLSTYITEGVITQR
jgi:hypothetical protein